MAANSASTQVIYVALAGNLLVALTKASAAAGTGSSAVLSEAIHSFVAIGKGRELFFRSFIVAQLVFALGALVSSHRGILHVKNPELIEDAFGVASILIGLVPAATATLPARESTSLLIGERADHMLSDSSLPIAEAAVVEIARLVHAAQPEVVTQFIKPQTAAAFKETVRRRLGGKPAELGLVENL